VALIGLALEQSPPPKLALITELDAVARRDEVTLLSVAAIAGSEVGATPMAALHVPTLAERKFHAPRGLCPRLMVRRRHATARR
jgi:hypothetical protein